MHKHLGVLYIYEELTEETISTERVSFSILRGIPRELLIHLEQATDRSDMEAISLAIEQIRSHNTPIAQALSILARDFKYDEILDLIRTK